MARRKLKLFRLLAQKVYPVFVCVWEGEISPSQVWKGVKVDPQLFAAFCFFNSLHFWTGSTQTFPNYFKFLSVPPSLLIPNIYYRLNKLLWQRLLLRIQNFYLNFPLIQTIFHMPNVVKTQYLLPIFCGT